MGLTRSTSKLEGITLSYQRSGRLLKVVLASVAIIVTLAGCGGVNSVGSAAKSSVAKQQEVIDVSRIHTYTSLAELASAASLIVVFEATGTQDVTTIGGIPFTITAISVLEVLKGDAKVGDNLQLRQVGPRVGSNQPVVTPGVDYLGFLVPFELLPGTSTGQYVIVGVAAGLYRASNGTFARVDSQSPRLPGLISVADVGHAIG